MGGSVDDKGAIKIDHDGKSLTLSHVDNIFFPRNAFLREDETDKIVTVDWTSLTEEVRQKITKSLKPPVPAEEDTKYDRELYVILSNPPSNIRVGLDRQAQDAAMLMANLSMMSGLRVANSEVKPPSNLAEEIAIEIATAKKKGEIYRKAFMPTIVHEILDWLKKLGLNCQRSGALISIDFSNQGRK